MVGFVGWGIAPGGGWRVWGLWASLVEGFVTIVVIAAVTVVVTAVVRLSSGAGAAAGGRAAPTLPG